MNTLSKEIKTLALQQADLKNQRKTVNFTGTRTLDPSKATYYHLHNRNKLRCMYMALGLLKGRTMLEVENNSKDIVNMHTVNAFIKKYEHEFKRNEQLCPNGLEHISTELLLQREGGTDAA